VSLKTGLADSQSSSATNSIVAFDEPQDDYKISVEQAKLLICEGDARKWLDSTPRCRENIPEIVTLWLKTMHKSRASRDQIFGFDLFSEPGWDMLLTLFAEYGRGKAISVSSLCYASGAPASTALRHLAKLEQEGLIKRSDDERDHRRVWIEPTVKALAGLRVYFKRCFLLT
jgi:DNA-binding MarR family transcriptional regulator